MKRRQSGSWVGGRALSSTPSLNPSERRNNSTERNPTPQEASGRKRSNRRERCERRRDEVGGEPKKRAGAPIDSSDAVAIRKERRYSSNRFLSYESTKEGRRSRKWNCHLPSRQEEEEKWNKWKEEGRRVLKMSQKTYAKGADMIWLKGNGVIKV